jgi:hypothetical protein
MKCPHCTDGTYTPFTGPQEACATCGGTMHVSAEEIIADVSPLNALISKWCTVQGEVQDPGNVITLQNAKIHVGDLEIPWPEGMTFKDALLAWRDAK